MTDNERYVAMVLEQVSKNLEGKNSYDVINQIAKRCNGLVVSQQDQYILGGVLGAMLHNAYCESRRLPESEQKDGLKNNPRLKEIKESIDADFIQMVKDGVIPTSNTLFFKDGKLYMDIANTSFVHLSPYWKKDNFLAGCAATRSILTNWEGLNHENPAVRKYVEIGVANAIHEAWIARGNVYYSEYNGQVYTNSELDTAYVNLSQEEKDKDLEHYKMAKTLINEITKAMNKTSVPGYGE